MVRFGRFELQPLHRSVLRDGVPLPIGSRAFDVLMALAQRSDRVVTKAELLGLVWPDTVVEENNLQVQISSLRKWLGPRTIVTVSGRGYRLVAVPAPGSTDRVPVRLEAPGASGPQPTSPAHDGMPALYGRNDDLAALRALLATHRLVTLVGAGGVGKTRLAQHVALALRDEQVDGAAIVDLALVTDPALVPQATAEALGVVLPPGEEPVAALGHALYTWHVLLVLDNCEHLVGATAAMVAALLAHTARLTLLVTSQEPLHVAQEQLFRVQALTVPSRLQPADLQALCESRPVADGVGAVALFAARAHEADLRFRLGSGTLDAVIAICRQLDGNPLAIELAAARVPVLGVDGVLARLDDRFRMLTHGMRGGLLRHQTLRAALDWSHALLNVDEQQVFWRLGAFTGAFTLSQAQEIAADARIDAWAVLDHLGALVEKSLVTFEPGDEPRYRLPETNRVYALERLQRSGQP